MRLSIFAAVVAAAAAVATVGFVKEAKAGNYIIYAQGRSMKSWTPATANASGWTNVTLGYDGSQALTGTATTILKNTIATYCGPGNSCVVHCYSAGCLRTLKAVSDLRAEGNTLPGLMWAEASGSAAGGSKLAELSTKGLTGMIAKLFGVQEKIDKDITPGGSRNTWGYIQDDMGKTMYHIAGAKNICKKFLFIKFCTGGFVGEGTNDGLVALHSAAGASSQATYTDGCAAPKYPWRAYDSGYVSCYGDSGRDHAGIVDRGSAVVASIFAGSTSDRNPNWDDAPTTAQCNNDIGECDQGYNSAAKQDFGVNVGAATTSGGASNAKVSTAGATCAGKCGGYSGSSCWCDTACASIGDCCSDYAASCNAYNANN